MKRTYIYRLDLSQNLGIFCDFWTTQLKNSPLEKFRISGKGNAKAQYVATKFKSENIYYIVL